MLSLLLSKEDIYKLKLIKKYAKIRFRRFWKEWGINKEEAYGIFAVILLFVFLFEIGIIGCMI